MSTPTLLLLVALTSAAARLPPTVGRGQSSSRVERSKLLRRRLDATLDESMVMRLIQPPVYRNFSDTKDCDTVAQELRQLRGGLADNEKAAAGDQGDQVKTP